MLYTFTLNVPTLADETTETIDESGQKITITKTVKKDCLRRFGLYKPTRQLVEDAELFYGVCLADGLRKGLIPRRLLAKKYEDEGGIVSAAEQAKRNELFKRFEELTSRLRELLNSPSEARTEEVEKLTKELTEEYADVYDKILAIENELNEIYQHTAENWARNKTLVWWILHLSAKESDGKFVDFFEGKTYEEKLAFNDKHFSNPVPSDSAALKRLAFLTGYWFNGKANSKESFDFALSLVDDDEFSANRKQESTQASPPNAAPSP